MVSYRLKLVERNSIHPKLTSIDFDTNIIEIREDLPKRIKAFLITKNKLHLKNKHKNKILTNIKANLISSLLHPTALLQLIFSYSILNKKE